MRGADCNRAFGGGPGRDALAVDAAGSALLAFRDGGSVPLAIQHVTGGFRSSRHLRDRTPSLLGLPLWSQALVVEAAPAQLTNAIDIALGL